MLVLMIVIVVSSLMRIPESIFNQLRMILKMMLMMLVKMICGQISFAANRVGVY